MYGLIMTIAFYTSQGTHFVVNTMEFASEKDCRYAGAQQETILRNDFKYIPRYSYICVKTKDSK